MTHSVTVIAIGVLFLAGLAIDAVGRRTNLPRVTLLILLGVVAGPPGLDVLPDALAGTDGVFTPTALTMVAFLLGGQLTKARLRTHGREILFLSLSVVIVSVALVAMGLVLAGVALPLALLLAATSAATEPAATRDVIRNSGQTGRFTTNLSGIVAIDDAWGILVFSLMLTLAGILTDNVIDGRLFDGLLEAGGAIALGLVIGGPAAFLTGRVKPGEPTLIEALGVVFLCAGLALYLKLSFLLTGMVAGMVIVNLASHHDRPFHEIERIEWPFMLLLFVMAGASLEIRHVVGIGFVGVAYVVLRFAARLLGGWIGGRLAGLSDREGWLTGLALMPQAGVAIGMALVASERFPEYAEILLAVTISSTIIFEAIGPILTQIAIKRMATGPAATKGRRS
jgi:Kef-type K+ transport system membrane component KefB